MFRKLLLVLLFLPLTVHAESAHIVRIGFVLPLSGEWAFLGNGIRDGAHLAQEDLRKKGQQLDLIFEDNHGDLSASATIGKELIEVRKVDALISIISGVGKLLKPLASRAGILNIGICSETEVADGRLSFINYLTAEQGVSKFLNHLGGHKSVGVYALNESGFQRIVSELRRQAGRTVDILFEENFDKGIADFRPLLLRRAAAKPDVLLILGLSPEIETLVKQARSIGINTPVASIEGFGLAADKTPFEDAWFVDSAVPNAQFRQRFVQAFHRDLTPGVGHAYDSVMLLAAAFAASTSSESVLDHEKAAEKFRQLVAFPGVVGPLNVRADGVIWSEASVKVIRNGQPELAQ